MPQTAEQQLKSFIAKFDRNLGKHIRECRSAMRKRFPTAHEMAYDNYNFFVIGYSPTERPSDAILSMAASGNGVGLCFIQGAKLPDPKRVLKGSGNQTRSIHVDDMSLFERPELLALIDMAETNGKPMPASGRGPLVIRSISKKQRPRRKAEGASRKPS
jgi:hypothetical protein